ncbi:MAG TPA: phosphotransferase [Pyrinomonadaceae bacterium]
MSHSHVTPLLAQDPALPQRDLLLDQTVMTEYLSRLVARYGDFGVQDCARLRTKYRVGTSLRVLYELSGNQRSYRIAARAFTKTHRVGNQFTSSFEIQAPELNTMFWIFPHDRKIKNLPVLNNIPQELREIKGQEWVESRIVGHAPEKSLTAQCLGASKQTLAYAKIYAGDEGRQIFNTYRYVVEVVKTEKHNLRIPAALAYHEHHHLLLLKSVSGVPLSALTSASRESAFFKLGQALKVLHPNNPPASLLQCRRFAPKALARAAETIGRARPDVASLVQDVTDKLNAQFGQCGKDEPVFLHGDVHPKNILLDNDRLVLLDLDQAAAGAAAVDLGSVIAGLYCDACAGSISWRQALSLRRAFLSGYGAPQNSQVLRWHIAAALVQERALRSVTRIRTANLLKLPQILQTAKAVLNGGIFANQVP